MKHGLTRDVLFGGVARQQFNSVTTWDLRCQGVIKKFHLVSCRKIRQLLLIQVIVAPRGVPCVEGEAVAAPAANATVAAPEDLHPYICMSYS